MHGRLGRTSMTRRRPTISSVTGRQAGERYIPALDGLRACAVIGVLAFHDGRLSGGFLGVDLFFALSGFLVTSLLLEEYEQHGSINLPAFWGRRFRRLLPAALLVLVTTVVFFRAILDPSEWITARIDAPWAQWYVANWHFVTTGDGYWDSFAAPSAFAHLWSLAIEEQFYLLWPIVVVLVVKRWGTSSVVPLSGVLAACSCALMLAIFDGGDPTRVYMGTDTRAFSLLVGAMFAAPRARVAARTFVDRRRRVSNLIFVALLGVVVGMWLGASGDAAWLFRGGLPLHSLVSASVVALAAAGVSVGRTIFGRSALASIGRLSYSLYLWHWPVFVVLSADRLGVGGWSVTMLRLAVTTVIALVSYVFVEQPIRHSTVRLREHRGAVALGVANLSLIAVWFLIPVPQTTNAVTSEAIQSGLELSRPADVTTSIVDVEASFGTTTSTVHSSDIEPGQSTTTTTTTTTSTTVPLSSPPVTSVFWYGDSIAQGTWPPLGAAFSALGIDAHSGAYGGVGLVTRPDFDHPWEILQTHLDTYSPDLLIFQLTIWDAYESSDDQIAAFEHLGGLLEEYDLRLALVTIPVRSPEEADPREPILIDNARDFASRHADRVVLFDQSEVLGTVYARDLDGDGVPERKYDGVHLCPTGALAVAFWLVDVLHERYEGIGLPDPAEWAFGEWQNDPGYDEPPGACAAVAE